MNKDFIENYWIPALKSGEYKQGTGALRTPDDDGQDMFCCLGVACDVIAKNKLIDGAKWEEKKPGSTYPLYFAVVEGESGAYKHKDYLPKPIAEYIGIDIRGTLTMPDGFEGEEIYSGEEVGDDRIEINLTNLNDDESFCFEDIAKVLSEAIREGGNVVMDGTPTR